MSNASSTGKPKASQLAHRRRTARAYRQSLRAERLALLTSESPPKWVTTVEFGLLTGLSRTTIWRRIKAGEIETVDYLGRKLLRIPAPAAE